VLYIVEAPPENGESEVITVHVDRLRLADATRVSEEDRKFHARKADTNIVERVLAHSGDSPETYRFYVTWRGWDSFRGSWEPLVGRTSDGKPAGVGHLDVV
jgi:hypothetical protein